MHTDLSFKEVKEEWHGSIKSYIIGFTASILLTLASFSLVIMKVLPPKMLVYTIAGLALVQAIFQLRFFLHVGQEAKPRWESLTFYFMLLILLIIVIGTLWIMSDLNDRVMEGMGPMAEETVHD